MNVLYTNRRRNVAMCTLAHRIDFCRISTRSHLLRRAIEAALAFTQQKQLKPECEQKNEVQKMST